MPLFRKKSDKKQLPTKSYGSTLSLTSNSTALRQLSEESASDDDDDDDNDDYDMSSTYTRTSYFSEYTTDTSDYHTHPVRASKCNGTSMGYLTALMYYCGLEAGGGNSTTDPTTTTVVTPQSDPSWDNVRELQRVMTVISPANLKLIPRLGPNTHHDTSVKNLLIINLPQVEFIKNLLPILKNILHKKKVPLLLLNDSTRSLYLRYGVFDLKLGKGSYGLIRLVRPCNNNNSTTINTKRRRKLYVVKEFIPRKDISIDSFVDKIISEFIIGKSMNYKHVNRCVDLMICVDNFKIMLVMDCTKGGDLFSYIKSFKQNDSDNSMLAVVQTNASCLTLAQVCCFIKQIAKGLLYMHDFGVAHCDIKLENILLDYVNTDQGDEDCNHPCNSSSKNNQGSIMLKLSDFGKSSVVRTFMDSDEQLYSGPPQGSEHFMAPEEFKPGLAYTLTSKDCWAMGILIALFFRILKKFKTGSVGVEAYMWSSVDGKGKNKDNNKYRDRRFQKYMETRQIANYDDETKEWLIQRPGTFKPIENLFDYTTTLLNDEGDEEDEDEDDNSTDKIKKSNRKNSHVRDSSDESSLLRKWIIYKLLDPNPDTRMTMAELLDTDWMVDVECCV
ncbi:uncharacterized protein KQ657_002903 [Scheffersomyces spartinae]|uniref:non-specific serine/threonine protein kinase n=1 Tax=Scheffersomyces spartinae TaxID=45513 RepID=A0A9P8AGE4_9ASCO|nr:uncharacterized protein KQ657_002903 [Scheffersomyces spartinae]KAG7191634.1 hypothetical protein KQ657_002903 [Scheffersomyces spartinae]